MAALPDKNSSRKHSCKFLVSACLAGIDCTYKGKNKLKKHIKRMVGQGLAIPACPEVLGGASIPRSTCEISGGDGGDVLDKKAKVVTPQGDDISGTLIAGARKTLRIAEKYGLRKAIMKSNSPSCGRGNIYDGTFGRHLIKGDGVATALLRRNNIKVYTEKDKTYE